MTPAQRADKLRAMNFTQITGCEDCDACLFFRKEEGRGEPTASLADSANGSVFTMKEADWQGLCEKIRSGTIN